MGRTSIPWTDFSVNPVRARLKVKPAGMTARGVGHYCEKISPGCKNCYASTTQKRFGMPPFEAKHRDDVEVFFEPRALDEVYRRRIPTRWFWCDMTDLFGAWVPFGYPMLCLSAMGQTPHHTHQVLTKRTDIMRDFFTRWADLGGELEALRLRDGAPALARGPEDTRKAHPSPRGQLYAAMLDAMGDPPDGAAYPTFDWMDGMIRWPAILPNVHVGGSIESREFLWRLDDIRATPAAKRFVSFEPLLDDLGDDLDLTGIDQAIFGGESGGKARPCWLKWIRRGVAACRRSGTRPYVKQLGARPVEIHEGDLSFRSFEDWVAKARSRLYPGDACFDTQERRCGQGSDFQRARDEGTFPVSIARGLRLDDAKGENEREWPEDLRGLRELIPSPYDVLR